MGKKTNWSPAENQALCRAWLAAHNAVAHAPAGSARTATFWGVVHQIFHAELETAVERAHNGLKIRWTRINRDVQKFAAIVQELQDQRRRRSNSNSGAISRGDDTNGANDSEQQCVEDAKEQFFKQHDAKFHFEACWKLLRHSPKWTQLLAGAGGAGAVETTEIAPQTAVAASVLADPPVEAAATAAVADDANTPSAPLPLSLPPPQFPVVAEAMARLDDVADAPPAVDSTFSSDMRTVISHNALGSSTNDSSSNSNNSNGTNDSISANHSSSSEHVRKRRVATYLPERPERNPIQQLQEVTSSLVDEMRHRNELLEEQNAIALFSVKPDGIEDGEARECFELLRRRYVKRMRVAAERRSTSAGVQSRSRGFVATSSAAAAEGEDALGASDTEDEDAGKRAPPPPHPQQRQGAEGAPRAASAL